MNDSSRWRKFLNKMASITALAISFVVAYAAIYVLVASSYFEQVRYVSFGTSFLTMAMLAILACAAFYFGVNLFLAIYRKDVKREPLWAFILEICVLILSLVIVYLVTFGTLVGEMTTEGYAKTLPYFMMGLAAIAFLFLIPLAKKKIYFGLVAVCVTVLIVGSVSVITVDVHDFAFDGAPAVFDNGTDFSVVWATNAVSIGYLEYTYNDTKYTVYDSTDGKYHADSRLHTVHVPYAHLYGNTYTVSSAKVLKNTPYTSKIGDFITSPNFTFMNKIEAEKMTMIAASDWHGDTKSLISAVAACKNFDVLVMMGDPANYFLEFEDIINNVIIPGGKITGGTKPILYVRGNHDLRGKGAEFLKEALGYDTFYYIAGYGMQNFIVFDGAEDKADDHQEYGGLLCSEQYRAEQLDYMDSLPVMGGFNICLCHIPRFTLADKEDEIAKFKSILEKWEVKLEISGHQHKLRYITGENYYDTLVDGGPINDGEQYVVCYISIDRGVANITAINSNGDVLEHYGPKALR